MSRAWQVHGSARVMAFLAAQSARDRGRLLALLEEMAARPEARSTDQPRKDDKGRTHWLRFQDGFAIIFWIDPWEKELRIVDVGFE